MINRNAQQAIAKSDQLWSHARDNQMYLLEAANKLMKGEEIDEAHRAILIQISFLVVSEISLRNNLVDMLYDEKD